MGYYEEPHPEPAVTCDYRYAVCSEHYVACVLPRGHTGNHHYDANRLYWKRGM